VLRLAYPVLFSLLLIVTALGLLVALLPALGYFPAIGGTELTFNHWQQLALVPGIGHSIQVSLLAGLVTPVISLAAVFLFLASASGGRLDSWIRRLASPVLAVPHAAAAFGLAFLIAPSGFLFRLVSPVPSGWERAPDLLIVNDSWGLSMITGLILKEIPFLLLMALAALPQLNPGERVRMARSLGYSPVIAWLKVVAPGLYPLLRLPLFAVIAFASATVDVAIILGPTLPPTLSVMLLSWFNDPDLQQRFLAGTAAMLQLALSLGAIGTWLLGERLIARLYHFWVARGTRSRGEWLLHLLGRTVLPLALGTMIISLIILLVHSLSGLWQFPAALPADWSLHAWQRALPGFWQPLRNTLLIAAATTAFSLLLVVSALEHEFRQGRQQTTSAWILYVPLITPQVAFLFGLVVIAESLHLQPGIGLVMLAHLLFILPYTYLTLAGPYRHLDPRWLQMAASLGVTPGRSFWRIRLPLLLAPLLTSAAIGMAISVSLFLPTQMAGAGRVATVTTEAVALASGGNASIIAVWAVLQTLVPMLGFLIALMIPRLVWRKRQGMQDLH
jgi:putative thiamine transport system permease protein